MTVVRAPTCRCVASIASIATIATIATVGAIAMFATLGCGRVRGRG